MVDASGPHKEQRLEEGMGKEMEHAHGDTGLGYLGRGVAFMVQNHTHGTQAQHHIADLADGGIGQHAFDVVGGQPHRGGKDSRKAADNGYHGDGIQGVDE